MNFMPRTEQKCRRHTIRQRKISRGFSLLELIIALGIIGIVLLPFLSFISFRLSKEHQSDEVIKAIEIAKSSMEEVLLLPAVKDSEEVIEGNLLLKVKVFDGDDIDEPINLSPVEIHVIIYRLESEAKLVEFYALK